MEIRQFIARATQRISNIHGLHWLWLKKVYQPYWRKKVLLATGVAFLLLIGTAILKIIQQAQVNVKTMPCFQIKHDSLVLRQLPSQLLNYADQITPAPIPGQSLNIFSATLTKEVAEAYLANPWVAQVHEICKQYPNRVYARLSLRNPAAWVACGETYFLTDTEKIRLPAEWNGDRPVNDYLPIIYGETSSLPEQGRAWQSEILARALTVLRFLSNQTDNAEKWRIVEVHLEPTLSHKVCIVLVTDNPHCRILWGESLAEEYPQITAFERFRAWQQLQTMLTDHSSEIVQADVRFGYLIIQEKGQEWKPVKKAKATEH